MFINLKKVPDAELLPRIARKSHPAFDELYNRYHGKLYTYFLRLTGNITLSQDLLQDVFLRVITRAGQFRPPHAVSTWLYAIAYHLFVNQVRRNGKVYPYDPAILDSVYPASSGYSDFHARLDVKMLRQAIADLLKDEDDEKRHTFVLRFEQDLSLQQIADIMSCPLGTVKSRLHYVLKTLNTKLQYYQQEKI